MQSYERLIGLVRERCILQSVESMLFWDAKTGMPHGAVAQRAEQTALMTRLTHRMLTDPQIARLMEDIAAGQEASSLSDVQRRNLFLISRLYNEFTQVPEELMAEIQKQTVIASEVWLRAKAQKDWRVFQPQLEKILQLKMRYSEFAMDALGVSNPYDVCLNWFERGMTSDYCAALFSEIKNGITPLIKRYAGMTKDLRTDFLKRRVEKETQLKIVEALAQLVGFDVISDHATGKLGETENPFATGVYDDVRIALRYNEHEFIMCALMVLHEAGHGLYRTNLNREWKYEPVGEAEGSGMSESQSRFLENTVGRSSHFASYFLPLLNRLTRDRFSDVTVEELARALNVIRPSPIRGGSDEVTYPIHLIVRFEIERAMFRNEISVPEIPEAWRDKYDKYLGVTVQDDSLGPLQEAHWAWGMFGYFPCYALGDVFAAQLAEAMEKQIPYWKSQIEAGDLRAIMNWMRTNIHEKGSLYDALDLMKRVTGKEVSAQPYLGYLGSKYANLYDS